MRLSARSGYMAIVATVTLGICWITLKERRTRPSTPSISVVAPDQRLGQIASQPEQFVAENEMSKDKHVQTLVTRARMISAYATAKSGNYDEAHSQFVKASITHKGLDSMDPGFGTLPEQAEYQAIVCLDADGKKNEAKAEYRKFIKEHQLSPLIHACFRRLERLNGNKPDPQDEALLQQGVEAQEKEIRFQTSVCGPKCIEKLLPLFGKPVADYRTLAKLCKTNDQGTTLAGLKDACERLGLKPIGLELNAKDFALMQQPFIWLQGDHYTAVLGIKGGKALVFDSVYRTEEERALPKTDDPKFRATVLAFEVPTTNLVSDHDKISKKS